MTRNEKAKIATMAFLVFLVILIYCFFRKNKLPDKVDILDELYQAPLQTEIRKDSFDVKEKGITYTISPLYEYALYGLVVSYHHSATWWDYYHEDSQDYLNVKDLCVIWGDNIASEVYKNMTFQSGSWTCYPDFKRGVNRNERSKYKDNCLSNNHLLLDKKAIRKTLMATRVGDQIYFKGYLVSYTRDGWGGVSRGTSTTRDDCKCETIYLTDYAILKKGNPGWDFLFQVSKYAVFVCAIVFFFV